MEPERAAKTIISELKSLADPVRSEGVQRYFKNSVVALGIETKTLREFANERANQLKSEWGLGDAVKLCDLLLLESELEIRGVGILILGTFQKQFSPELLKNSEKWLLTRLDNWALVDSFCGMVLSPLLTQYELVLTTLRRWSQNESLWVRRAALVTLVPFARRGRYLDLSYELAERQFDAQEDLMHKAMGWLLREAGKTDMLRLRKFLVNHGASVPRTALRYAIEKFSPSDRKQLLESTRASSEDRTLGKVDSQKVRLAKRR